MKKQTRQCLQCGEYHTSERALRCIDCQGKVIPATSLRIACLVMMRRFNKQAPDRWARAVDIYNALQREATECEAPIGRVRAALGKLCARGLLENKRGRWSRVMYYRAR